MNSVNMPYKKKIGLSLIAICLSLVPFILVFLSNLLNLSLPGFVILFIVLSPIAGLTTGIVSLCKGKKRIGIIGMILSIAAIAAPVFIIVLIIVFLIGASMGLISLM